MSFRVLHIEDSEIQIHIVRSLLAKNLPSEDYIYTPCHTLEEARKLMDQGCLDVVLVDLMLPDSTGINSVRAVREMCPNIPIIVLTGTDNIDIAKASIHAGASSYVRKCDISALPLILILTVEKWEMEKQLQDRCQLYDSVVNLTPDYICRFRPNGIVTFVNKSFADLCNMIEGEMQGTLIGDYLDGAAKQQFTTVGRVLANQCEIADGGEFTMNGRWISWRASAIRNVQGHVTEVQCVGRDTTYRHQRTKELLELARNRMSDQHQEIKEKTDEAFSTLFETERMLAKMEGG